MENSFEEVLLQTAKILNQTSRQIEHLRAVLLAWNKENDEARRNLELQKYELTKYTSPVSDDQKRY